METASIDFPEYDLRRAATARDPLAVIEGYKIEILLRLASVCGVRMCPDCPRCNANVFGCQDKFGSNMRPGGGIFGGMTAFGGATEHQGYGTPHFHAEGHIVCAYQFHTLAEVVQKMEEGKFAFEDVVRYQEWMHCEDVLDAEARDEMMPTLEQEWHERFSNSRHDDMSCIPEYLVQDASEIRTKPSLCDAQDDLDI